VPTDWTQLFTPVGLLALVVAGVQAWLRYREDKPRLKALEIETKVLHEENLGLNALVKQRYDFGAAVDVMKAQTTVMSGFMAEIVEAIKTGHDLRGQLSQRIEQMDLRQTQEHKAITDALTQNTDVLRDIHATMQGAQWDGRKERRSR
jgi:flagellar hook-basal body complex protein FliE